MTSMENILFAAASFSTAAVSAEAEAVPPLPAAEVEGLDSGDELSPIATAEGTAVGEAVPVAVGIGVATGGSGIEPGAPAWAAAVAMAATVAIWASSAALVAAGMDVSVGNGTGVLVGIAANTSEGIGMTSIESDPDLLTDTSSPASSQPK